MILPQNPNNPRRHAIQSAAIIFAIYGAYGLLFSTGGARGVYQKFQRAAEAVFGSMFALLGVFMIGRAT